MQRSSRLLNCIWQRPGQSLRWASNKKSLTTKWLTQRQVSSQKGATFNDSFSRRSGVPRSDMPRPIAREENMWRDPKYLDTKWLNPRDPTRYRPNFKNTEPQPLRKQFMRCPDERSRDLLGRDWEDAIKMYREVKRSEPMVTDSGKESLKMARDAEAVSKARQRRAQLRQRNILTDDEEGAQE